MAFVRVEQRSAHLATPVRLTTVTGRNGPVSKATFTAISNAWRGAGDQREEEATAILWTLWGKAAEGAARVLSRGSHVNITGRVQNNNYDKDGTTVYGMAFTAEQVDYLDSRATGEALRQRQEAQEHASGQGNAPATPAPAAAPGKGGSRGRKAAAKAPASTAGALMDDDIPF